MTVVHGGDASMPSFIYIPEIVSEVCVCKACCKPTSVHMLNKYDCLLGFPTEEIVTHVAMGLHNIEE